MAIKRRIIGEEGIFYHTPEANVSIVARIKGNINETQLKSAIEKVSKVHPAMRAHVETDENGKANLVFRDWFQMSLKILPMDSDDQWMKEVLDEMERPFDFNGGPLIRFVWLKSAGLSDIILVCQHLICDGLSLTSLAGEILAVMADPQKELAAEEDVPLPVSENINIPRQNRIMGWISRFLIHRFNKKWEKTGMVFDQEDFLQIHRAFFEKYRYQIIQTEFSRQDTQLLIDACRKNKITVNSAICSAFLAGRQSVMGRYGNPIQGIGVNVRDRLEKPAGNVLGCFVSDIGFKFDYDAKKNFWENGKIYHRLTRLALDKYEDLKGLYNLSFIDSGLLEAMTFARHVGYSPEVFAGHPKLSRLAPGGKNLAVKLSGQGMSAYPGLLITNMGILKLDSKYGALELEKLFFAPSSMPLPEGGLIIGVATFNRQLTISLNSMAAKDNNGYLDLLNKINLSAVQKLKDEIK